jgi:hypothetical protein
MWDDNKTLGISKRWHSVIPPPTFVGIEWKKTIDKTNEWATWWWANVKINKKILASIKQIVNILKEDMEDYH